VSWNPPWDPLKRFAIAHHAISDKNNQDLPSAEPTTLLSPLLSLSLTYALPCFAFHFFGFLATFVRS